jgi:hypothetical protein
MAAIEGSVDPDYDIEGAHFVLAVPEYLAHQASHVIPGHGPAGNLARHHHRQARQPFVIRLGQDRQVGPSLATPEIENGRDLVRFAQMAPLGKAVTRRHRRWLFKRD